MNENFVSVAKLQKNTNGLHLGILLKGVYKVHTFTTRNLVHAFNFQILNLHLQVSCLFQEPLAHECPQMTKHTNHVDRQNL